MDKLIPIISEIHDIIRKSQTNLQLSLPIVAVVGSQSTGKSSLLQSIIGKQFLPKGRGIVTRRPIEIQLIHIDSDKQYAEFNERKGEHIEDFDLVRKGIDIQTEKICGNTKGVSPVPIKLRIYSKNVLDLLLVDLPGITKNPIGDQPKDIEQQVLKIVRHYIKNQNCIIMAVSKATDDIANSESLKLARQVDNQGKRTIGVVTQMDLIEENLDLIKDFTNLANPLKLGYVGLFLRSNKVGVSITQQYLLEKQFFQKHSTYSKYADKMGVKYLIKTLNSNFMKHIQRTLPVIKQNIVSTLQLKKHELRTCGEFEKITDKKAQGMLILILISKYVKYFSELIQGRSIDNRYEIVGGARIHYIFQNIFNKSILNMDPFEFLTDQDLRTAIKNANGLSKSLFVPEIAFQNLIRQQICRLQLPSLECSHLIHEQLKRLLNFVILPQIQRFEKLNIRIYKVMQDLLKQCLNKTESMIKNLIEIELGYINRNHPDFIDIVTSLQNPDKNGLIEKKEDKGDKNRQSGFAFHKKKDGYKSEVEVIQMRQNKQEKYKNQILQKSEYSGSQRSYKNQSKDFSYIQLTQMYNINKIFNNFPRFSLPGVPQVIRVAEQPKARQQTQTQLIKRLITSYFNVVKKNINDSIPKAIITFLVNEFKNSCEKVLVSNLYKQEEFEQLLYQNQDLLKKRNQIKKGIVTLRQCLNQISKFNSRFI